MTHQINLFEGLAPAMPRNKKEDKYPSGYLAIKAKYPQTLVFMQRESTKLEAFGDDARIVAKLTNLGLYLVNGIEACGFYRTSLDHFIEKLIKGGYRVAIAEPVPDTRKKS